MSCVFFRCLITRSPGTLVNNIFRPRPIPVKLFSTKFINYLSQTRHHSVFTWFSRFFLKTRQRINTEKLADAEFFDKNWKKLHFCGWEIGKEYSNLKHPKLLRFKQSWHPIAGKFRPQFSMNRYNSKFNIPNIILSSRISKNWYSGPNFIKKLCPRNVCCKYVSDWTKFESRWPHCFFVSVKFLYHMKFLNDVLF